MLHIGLLLRNVICQYLHKLLLGNNPGVLVSQTAELIKQTETAWFLWWAFFFF